MNTLESLLRELCPNGVEHKTLGECCTIAKGVQLNREGLLESGPYPVINGGIDASGYWNESNFPANRITVSQGGASAGFVNFMHVPFWAGAHCFVLEKTISGCSYRFLWHCLKQNQTVLMQRKEGAGIPGLGKSTLASISIPLPPLPVQEEIVRRLDAMQEVVEALEVELALRRKQYETVRETLFAGLEAYGGGYRMLGEIATSLHRGFGITRDQVQESGTPCVRYGEIYTNYGPCFSYCISHTDAGSIASPKWFSHGDILFAITGEKVEDIAKSTAYLGDEDCLAGGDIVVMKHEQDPVYLCHALSTISAQRQKSRGKVKSKVVHSSVPEIAKITIPLPPLSVQREIAKKLDAFDKLANVALPAEIAARRRAMEAVRERCFAALEASA